MYISALGLSSERELLRRDLAGCVTCVIDRQIRQGGKDCEERRNRTQEKDRSGVLLTTIAGADGRGLGVRRKGMEIVEADDESMAGGLCRQGGTGEGGLETE